MKLSIITPYYNCLNYVRELSRILEPQLTDEVEWIIIDDGCNETYLDTLNATVIHLPENTGCAGIPRNHGLDIAKGDYITFIDADDFVSDDFVSKILDKIDNTDFDYCLISWKHFPDYMIIDVTNGRPDWNCSVWGIVYKKEIIGDTRFNDLKIAEDYYFYHEVLKGKEEKITDVLYYYRSNPDGLTVNHGRNLND